MSARAQLLGLDLNALHTLHLVFRLGSFSRAADVLDVKQPTVSYTIDRLRKVLDDPLFVRQGGRTAPTDRCRELMVVVERILTDVEHLENPDTFDPSSFKGEITINVATLGLQSVVPAIMRRLRSQAPGIHFHITSGHNDTKDLLLGGEADIVLSANETEASGIYAHKKLFEDSPFCVMDPGNPLVGTTLSKADLANAAHVNASPWPHWRPAYMVVAEGLGIPINVVATVTDPSGVAFVIPGTDLISGLPSRVARNYAGRLGFARFPFEVTTQINMYWAATSNRSQLNMWMRNIIIEESNNLKLCDRLDLLD